MPTETPTRPKRGSRKKAEQEEVPVAALGEFEGDTIIRSEIAVTKIGDGLSDALKVDPVALHRGSRVFLVVEATVRHVAFPPVEKDSDLLARKHILDAEHVALVNEDDVRALLDSDKESLRKALDSMKGQGDLDDPENGLAATAEEEAARAELDAAGIDTSDAA